MNSKARKLAEQDESFVMASGIPHTIIRAGSLQNTPGGKQGFSFKEVLFIHIEFSIFNRLVNELTFCSWFQYA